MQISDKWHHLVYLPSLKGKKSCTVGAVASAQENSLSAAAVSSRK
jgi:hypothetical protein